MDDVEIITLHQPVAVVLHCTHTFLTGCVVLDVEVKTVSAVREHQYVMEWIPAAVCF